MTDSVYKPKKEDSERKDEYMGQYKDTAAQMSEAEKYGTDQNPVKEEPLPAKNLKKIG